MLKIDCTNFTPNGADRTWMVELHIIHLKYTFYTYLESLGDGDFEKIC